MSQFIRRLILPDLLKKKSFFLYGPRATGKSTLIRNQLGDQALVVDLLRSENYFRLSDHPEDLESIIALQSKKKWVVIDEVQKLPALLDEVHRLIEEKQVRFLLTGSSARKLKRGHANLLAGRAWTANLYPLSWSEIPKFDLERYLRYGGLPAVYGGQEPNEELGAYTKMYLYEEIQAEGIVRKLPQFARFLTAAALSSGNILNYAQIASDTAVSASTIREHYSILEDTLLGFEVRPWVKSVKRKAIATSKFFLFDCGVTHALAQTRHLDRNSDLYGRSFEQWIGMELRSYLGYTRSDETLSYWQSTHKLEVDFLIGDRIAIEVKATRRVSPDHLKSIKALQEEQKFKSYYLVSQDPIEAMRSGVHCIPWNKFMRRLWDGEVDGVAK